MTHNHYAPPSLEITSQNSVQKYPTLKLVSVVALGHIGLLLLSGFLFTLFKSGYNIFDDILPILTFITLISGIPTVIIGLFIVIKKYTKNTSHIIHLFLVIFVVTVLNSLLWSYISLTLYSGYQVSSYLIDVLTFVFAVGFIFTIVMTLILKLVLPNPNFLKGDSK